MSFQPIYCNIFEVSDDLPLPQMNVSCQLRAKTIAGSEIILMNKAERSLVLMELKY